MLQKVAGQVLRQQVAALNQSKACLQIFLLPGPEQVEGLLHGAAGGFGNVQKNEPALAIKGHGSTLQHQELLRVGIAEPQLAVEAGAVGGHQINPLNAGDRGGVQQLLYNPSTKAPTL